MLDNLASPSEPIQLTVHVLSGRQLPKPGGGVIN